MIVNLNIGLRSPSLGAISPIHALLAAASCGVIVNEHLVVRGGDQTALAARCNVPCDGNSVERLAGALGLDSIAMHLPVCGEILLVGPAANGAAFDADQFVLPNGLGLSQSLEAA